MCSQAVGRPSVSGQTDARTHIGMASTRPTFVHSETVRGLVEASLSIEHPLRTPPPDKPWARPTRTRVRTVHSAILRLAGVLHGHNLLRAPHKHLQRLCKIWSLVRRITSEVAAAGAAATVSSLSLSGMPIQCG